MISKWQGGASLVHLLWHFSLSAHKRTGDVISVCLLAVVVVINLGYLPINEKMKSGIINMWKNR